MGTRVGKNPTPWVWSCPVPTLSRPVVWLLFLPRPCAPNHISFFLHRMFLCEVSYFPLNIVSCVTLYVFTACLHTRSWESGTPVFSMLVSLLGPAASTGWGLSKYMSNEWVGLKMTLHHSWRDLGEFSFLLEETVLQMIFRFWWELAEQKFVPYMLDNYTSSYQNCSTVLPVLICLYYL